MPNLFHGVVSKTGAMSKTVTVLVHRKVEHPKLLKEIIRTTKFLVHDENETSRIGDKVTIIHGKPFSKRKHYRILSIDKAAPVFDAAPATPAATKTEQLLQETQAVKSQ